MVGGRPHRSAPTGIPAPRLVQAPQQLGLQRSGAAFERETGVDIYDSLEERLAIPLHFEDWDRSMQQKAGDLAVSQYAAYPIWVSTRYMAPSAT